MKLELFKILVPKLRCGSNKNWLCQLHFKQWRACHAFYIWHCYFSTRHLLKHFHWVTIQGEGWIQDYSRGEAGSLRLQNHWGGGGGAPKCCNLRLHYLIEKSDTRNYWQCHSIQLTHPKSERNQKTDNIIHKIEMHTAFFMFKNLWFVN